MEILIAADRIQQRVREMADEIERDYPADDEIHLVRRPIGTHRPLLRGARPMRVNVLGHGLLRS